MLHPYALREVLEQNGIVCHAMRGRVRQGGLVYAGTGLSICAGPHSMTV